jgi:hypothetical protein
VEAVDHGGHECDSTSYPSKVAPAPLQRPFIGLDLGGDWLIGGREAAALHCMPETGGLRRRPGRPGKSRIDAGDPNPRWG